MAALPYEHPERVTPGLSAGLRRQLLAADVHEMPKWATSDVTGATEFADLRGRTEYQYPAAGEGRRPFESATTLTRPGRVRTESR
jgi:hypothetical protein